MNYILKYAGSKSPDENKLNSILRSNNVKIVDGSMSPKMLLVDLAGVDVNKLQVAIKGEWDVFPEKKYGVPDTRRKIRK
jgi:hypothetical protein